MEKVADVALTSVMVCILGSIGFACILAVAYGVVEFVRYLGG